MFPDGPVQFRLLDLGGDKFVAGGAVDVGRNPFEGYRSLRVLLDHPEVLRNQVQAFALAAKNRPLDLLLPMVSSVEELRRIRELIDDALRQLPPFDAQTRPRIGAMIELPAAVEIARHLAREVDFFSIGTNDLIQYALAVDRENSRVASASDSYHPAILRMIQRTVEGAHCESIPVGVCGEMASDWRLAMAMIAMDVDSLSVTPSLIPSLKKSFAQCPVETLAEEIDALLALPDAASIEEALESYLPRS